MPHDTYLYDINYPETYILKMEFENQSLNEKDHKPGSTFVKCNRRDCNWHRGIDSFTAGKNRVRVRVDARPDGVVVNHVNLENTSGGRSYQFTGEEVSKLGGSSKLVEKGDYRITHSYSYVGTSGPKQLTIFVRW